MREKWERKGAEKGQRRKERDEMERDREESGRKKTRRKRKRSLGKVVDLNINSPLYNPSTPSSSGSCSCHSC